MKKKRKRPLVLSRGMVDISHKSITSRRALASACVHLGRDAFKALVNHSSPKGDVLETARVAAVMAAKDTSCAVPLCHPLLLTKVQVDFELKEKESAVVILGDVRAQGQTGVEMEALHAVTLAALTIYDMLKGVAKDIVISDIMLREKTGGKSGDYRRER